MGCVRPSDTEDEEDSHESASVSQAETQQNNVTTICSLNNKRNLDSSLTPSLGKLVDDSILHITQQFIKSNRSISLNQRVFGMVRDLETTPTMDTNSCDEDEAFNIAIAHLWDSLFSNRVSQRGVEMVHYPETEQSVDQRSEQSYSYDGIALYRSFRATTEEKASGDDVLLPKALHMPLPLTLLIWMEIILGKTWLGALHLFMVVIALVLLLD